MRITLFTLFLLLFMSVTSTAESLRVKWVYDGDTILLNNGLKVRYIGINTPETAHGDKKSEFFGYEAKKENIKLVKGRKVVLIYDVEKRDRYRRALAYVFLENGTFVNAELLRNGFAHCLVKKPNLKYSRFFLKLQKEAIKKRLGMWKKLSEIKGPLYGNKKSFRFHKRSCESALQMKKLNTVVFQSKKDAFMQGYAPCRECRP